QASIINTVLGNYNLKYGGIIFVTCLILSLLLGALALWYLTKNLRVVIETVRRFKDGDYAARIDPDSSKDLSDLSMNFNAMADQIVANIDQQKSLENLRRELIANISHDLRTPLSIIQGYAETLLIKEDQIGKDEKNKYLKIILDSSENVNQLVNQLFEYSKLEAKQVEAQKEPFSLAELVNDIFMKYQIIASNKNQTIELKQGSSTPLVFADVSLVERVIQNLMDNAIKFTPEGGKILLELNISEDSVQCSVSDNGIGISEKDQVHIFERYHRSERTKKPSGAGLGLAIAKKIMEIHQSTLKVRSKLNEGTSFIFDLPIYKEQLS
ncbi:MAG: HAMP domain-containing sensor histidine kinase, partial [Bacteroidota bacterium]